MSAATHELKKGGGRSFNKRYTAVLDHYGVKPARIEPGKPNQNGIAERGNGLLKTRLEQALQLRGCRDFATEAEYFAFVDEQAEYLSRRSGAKLEEERASLLPLPSTGVPSYTTLHPKVRRHSTIRVAGRVYSVPSRLIGQKLEVRQHANELEVLYKGKLVERLPRLRGQSSARIDYRHVIWSLIRKPGAFARYRFREELFPSLIFRRAYDGLCRWHGDRADIECVRILHLAASTFESQVEQALKLLLDSDSPFDYAEVKALAEPEQITVPTITISQPDLTVYDAMLGGVQ